VEKDQRLEVRMTKEQLNSLDRIAQSKQSDRSEVIRNLVANESKKLNKK
jgi:metal-responsive CopG/Arc/MetJ family transcriptional regulator